MLVHKLWLWFYLRAVVAGLAIIDCQVFGQRRVTILHDSLIQASRTFNPIKGRWATLFTVQANGSWGRSDEVIQMLEQLEKHGWIASSNTYGVYHVRVTKQKAERLLWFIPGGEQRYAFIAQGIIRQQEFGTSLE